MGSAAAPGEGDLKMNESRGYSAWIHGLSIALTVAVFPLIWVGGLVTTYDAGMAVPDWPGTYGWNMFAYPASTWLFGPFDLLVEHSHRLLGALAGILSIFLVIAAFRMEKRPWFRWWSVVILVSVVAQGALGGARVVLDQRTFAMIHGCTGPLFFALATATAVMSSRWWRCRAADSSINQNPGGIQPSVSKAAALVATFLLIASYFQLVVGAQLRHATGLVSPGVFTLFVHSHLTLAASVLLTSLVVLFLLRKTRAPSRVGRTAQFLVVVVLVQIALGIGTWVVNYALPWPELTAGLAAYTIQSKGFWESLIVTAHMATGSLIISFSTVVMLRAWRFRAAAP